MSDHYGPYRLIQDGDMVFGRWHIEEDRECDHCGSRIWEIRQTFLASERAIAREMFDALLKEWRESQEVQGE